MLVFEKYYFCEGAYDKISEKQLLYLERVKQSPKKAFFLFGTHKECITYGNRFKDSEKESLLLDNKNRRLEFYQSDRGGELTWHGPGQLIFYPIFDLSFVGFSISDYVCFLLKSTSAFLNQICDQEFEIGNAADSGIYLNKKKLVFIGLRIRENITYHGISINLSNDLDVFSEFDACGLRNRPVTSLAEILKRDIDQNELKKIGLEFSDFFQARLSEAFLSISS